MSKQAILELLDSNEVKRGRHPKLTPQDILIVKEIWLKSNQPCGKRLHSMIPTWIEALAKRRKIDGSSRERILSVSSATIDRVLSKFKVNGKQNSNKQTISALKQSIPIINTTRTIEEPGHLYADTVAHCILCSVTVFFDAIRPLSPFIQAGAVRLMPEILFFIQSRLLNATTRHGRIAAWRSRWIPPWICTCIYAMVPCSG